MRYMIASLALASTTAFACPDLSGHWAKCLNASGNPGVIDVTISQSVSRGVTSYKITQTDELTNERESHVVVANGRSVRSQDTTEVLKISCVGNQAVKVESIYGAGGEAQTTVVAVMSKENGVLITRVSGILEGEDQTEVTTCQ